MRFLRWVDKYLEESLMLVLLAAMVCIMGLQVFMRYVLASSLSWPEELTRYMFIWFVFLGIGYGIRYDIHIRVNILETFFPKIEKTLRIIQDAVFFGFLIYMIKPALNGVGMMIRTGQHSPAIQVPMYCVYVSLLIGFLIAIVRLIQKYVLLYMKKNTADLAEESKEQ